MVGHIGELLASDAFMPHGMCFLWQPALLWLHALSDGLIALSYYSIPVALLYFVARRKDLAFPAVFLLFGVFILACGTTHVMEIWTLWHPDYWLEGAVKVVTAIASVLSAVLLWRILPMALALPGRGDLEAANRALAGQVAERMRREEETRRLNAELERRVAERTADLEASNGRLRRALADKDVLLDEIRHRVKNNLQVVSGLLSLQARNAQPPVRLQLEETQERIRAMGRVHDQLYRQDEAGVFEVDRLVGDMCQDLGHLYGSLGEHVSCAIDSPEPLTLPVDLANPLALILNEAVGNAFKHGFPEGRRGRIVVSLRRTADGVRIEVRDDGVGLAPDHEARASRLVGIRLIRLLAAQIKADISWQTQAGTAFTLDLRVPSKAAATT